MEFLNSVIVDMQRKNDDLKTKLELYESAGILDESVEFIFNGVSARLVDIKIFASTKMFLQGCPSETLLRYL